MCSEANLRVLLTEQILFIHEFRGNGKNKLYQSVREGPERRRLTST